MATQRVTVDIHRPVEEVFAYMNDISREPEWQPQLREAEQIPPGPPAVGSRRRYVTEFMGRRVENTYVLRALEPGRRLLLETTPDSSLEATSEVTWQEIPGGTRVTMSLDGRPKGALRLIPRRMLERAFQHELTTTLDRLKHRLESGT